MLIRDDLLQVIEALGGAESLTYVSVPITSGRREFDLMERLGARTPAAARALDLDAWRDQVKAANERAAAQHVAAVRHRLPTDLVLNPAVLSKSGWEQDDYNGLWIDVIERYAKRVIATPEWAWSRGARIEIGAALFLGRGVESVDGQSRSLADLVAEVRACSDELEGRGWSTDEIDAILPPFAVDRPALAPGPASQAFEWLAGERRYQVEKFGTELDDEHTRQGLGDETWWRQQLLNYLHRAHVLGLELPVGRQAAAKFTATACGLLESLIRVHGPLPPPGVPSGELHGRDDA
jgi:hypothetical protein